MIVDRIGNWEIYKDVVPSLEKAVEFIKHYHKNPTEAGEYIIDGDKVYAIVQEYETKSSDTVYWEGHKTYIDLQYIVHGTEKLMWSNTSKLTILNPYNKDKDFTRYEGLQSGEVYLNEGMFAVFFPEDAHKPRCIFDKKSSVIKIVVKLMLV